MGFTSFPDLYANSKKYYLQPFPLDYHQTLLSFLDVLSEVYNKISRLLGPSSFPHSSQHMMGPLGLLSAQPGVSYLFSGDQFQKYGSNTGNPTHGLPSPHLTVGPGHQDLETTSGSLWSIANASNIPHGAVNVPPATSWTNSLGEMVLKIDGKLKVRLMSFKCYIDLIYLRKLHLHY